MNEQTDKHTWVLFFLHVPKCAGMSLTNGLLDRLPSWEIYQSTSLVRNFRENRPEFVQIADHKKLRAVVGHWLHEAMLPALRKPILFASSIRNPVERIRSQYRFDMGMRNASWQAENPEAFLERSRNVIVTFVNRAFPTIAARYTDPVESCKAILSGFDCLFDVTDADHWIGYLTGQVVGPGPKVKRVNESGGVDAELPFTDAEIAAYCEFDTQVYEWFNTAKSEKPDARNPVFDADARHEFALLGNGKYRPHIVADYLVPRVAMELYNDLADTGQAMTTLRASTHYSLLLERAVTDLLHPPEE